MSEGKAWKVSGPIGHSEREERGLFTFRRRVHSKLVGAAAARALASLLAALERLWFSKRGGVAMHHAL